MKKLLLLVGLVCCFALLAGQAGAEVIGEAWTPDARPQADPTTYYTELRNPNHTLISSPFKSNEFGIPTELTATNNFTLREVSMLQINTGGYYTFGLRSDDGSLLWLGDWIWPLGDSIDFASLPELPKPMPLTLVVNNDGDHGPDPNVYDEIQLEPGLYGIMVGYYEKTGGETLRVMYKGPDTGNVEMDIPAGVLYAPALISPAVGATNPTPGIGQTEVGIGTQTLSWQAIPGTPALQEWQVYLSGNLADIADPNSTAVTPFVVTDPDPNNWMVSVDNLVNNTAYYWRADAVASGGGSIITGPVWQFATEDWGPIFTTQPVDTLASPACTGILTAAAANRNPARFDGAITYEWFQVVTGGADLSVGTGDTVAVNYGESYYCVATNDIRSEVSNVVSVTMRTYLITCEGIGPNDYRGGFFAYIPASDEIKLRTYGNNMRNASPPDDCRFAYRQTKGDFDIRCRISYLNGGNGGSGWRKFGLMVRQDLTPGSVYALMCGTKSNGSHFLDRRVPDAQSTSRKYRNTIDPAVAAVFPSNTFLTSDAYGNTNTNQYWVRLTRVGETITGYVSDDATNWIEYFTYDYSGVFTDPVYVGIFNNCDHDDGWCENDFANITLNGARFLNVPWEVANITTNADPGSGWVDYTNDAIVSWTYGEYTPCDAIFSVYATPNVSEMSNPPLIATTSDLSATISAASLAHDQTWYYRIDVTSVAGGGDTQQGTWNTFETGKWIPSITVNPDAQYIVSAPSTLALSCQAATMDDDFANLTGFTWKKIVGTKDDPKKTGGDDVIVYTGTPTLLGVDGARNWDCSTTLSISGIADEGTYYCVVRNTSGVKASTDALVVTKRLVLYYDFENITDGTVADASASGLTGVLTSSTTGGQPVTGGIVPGIVGNAIKLIGGQDPNAAFIETGALPFDLGIDGAKPRSVSVWAKARSINSGGLWDMGSYADSQNCSLRKQPFGRVWDNLDNNAWRVQHFGNGDIDFNYAPSFDTWVHFVYIYDGANCQIYANGQKIVDKAVALNTGNDVSLKVGVWSNNNVFDGLIDEFRVYNYALSPVEIGQLYVEVAGGTVCAVKPDMDRNNDCRVDMLDFVLLAEAWAESTVIAP